MPSDYCPSRHRTVRRLTRVVNVGGVAVGGNNPIRVQSMTTSDTEDIAATVAQAIRLAEAGCEIIRITAPNKAAAAALKDIRQQFRAAGFSQPLVADIHFLPAAAMEAVEHVEKVRVNPGNYADKKKFAVLEYTDAAYAEELERLHAAFSPLVLRAKELGIATDLIEQAEEVGGTVAAYPRKKMVMTQPMVLPLHGLLPKLEWVKEDLVALWTEVVRRHALPIRLGVRLKGVERGADAGHPR